jgi:S-adenosylmethionine-diacylgycerolhomoserine-N-methlytransferase
VKQATSQGRAAGWRDDLRVLRQLVRGKPASGDHARDLDAFYGPQAHAYDDFRERLLPGRAEFMQALPLAAGDRVIDFGAGTGRHWLHVEQRLPALARLDLVDLCTPLLEVAHGRFASVATVHPARGDAQTWRAEQPADAAIFSYSMSMIPDWRAALANALAQVRPGGILGVIDFCTLPAMPPPPLQPLPGWARWLWPRWFAHDGVMLREDTLPSLLACSETIALHQGRARLPYLPVLDVPWFFWIGRVPAAGDGA